MPKTITIPMSPDLRAALDAAARDAGVPAEEFARHVIEVELETRKTQAFFERMRASADLDAFDRLLNRTDGEPPQAGDER